MRTTTFRGGEIPALADALATGKGVDGGCDDGGRPRGEGVDGVLLQDAHNDTKEQLVSAMQIEEDDTHRIRKVKGIAEEFCAA